MSYVAGQYPGTEHGPGMVMSPPPAAKLRPGRAWYLVALALLLGGVAWLIIGLASLTSQINAFQRVPLPTSHGLVSLSHAGSYVVYYEAPGAASGTLPSFNVRIYPASAGASVRSLAPYGTSVTYTSGSRQGRAALALDVARPGRFLVIAPRAPVVAGGSDLAFGSSLAGGIVGTVVASVLLILVGLAGLVVIFVVRRVKLSRRQAPGQPA
jgi:uncharacterized membrane protein YuzA (DUF378 family)